MPEILPPEGTAISPTEDTDDRSFCDIYSLLPHWIDLLTKQINPSFYNYSDDELEDLIFNPKHFCDKSLNRRRTTVRQLRAAIWDQYDLCRKNPRRYPQLDFRVALHGILSVSVFLQWCKTTPLLVLILRPFVPYTILTKEIHQVSMHRLLQIVEQSPMRTSHKTGEQYMDTKLAELQLKVFEAIDQRIHGSIIQRSVSETKNLNVTTNVTSDEDKRIKTALSTSIEQLDARIRELRASQEKMQLLPPIQTDMDRLVRPDLETAEIKRPR